MISIANLGEKTQLQNTSSVAMISSIFERLKNNTLTKKDFSTRLKLSQNMSANKEGKAEEVNLSTENSQTTIRTIYTKNGPLFQVTVEGNEPNSTKNSPLTTYVGYNGFITVVNENNKEMLAFVDSHAISTTHDAKHQLGGSLITENGLNISFSQTSQEETPTGKEFDFVEQVAQHFDLEWQKAEKIQNNNKNLTKTQNEMYMNGKTMVENEITKFSNAKEYNIKLAENMKMLEEDKIGAVVSDTNINKEDCTIQETTVMTEFGPLTRTTQTGSTTYSLLQNPSLPITREGTAVTFKGFIPSENGPLWINATNFVSKTRDGLDHFGLPNGIANRDIIRNGEIINHNGENSILNDNYRSETTWDAPNFVTPDDVLKHYVHNESILAAQGIVEKSLLTTHNISSTPQNMAVDSSSNDIPQQ